MPATAAAGFQDDCAAGLAIGKLPRVEEAVVAEKEKVIATVAASVLSSVLAAVGLGLE